MRLFAVNPAKASEFADELRMIQHELAEAEAHLEDVAKAIESNEEDFMSRNDVGVNIELAAKAVNRHAESLGKIAKALDDTVAMAKNHEGRVLGYLNN